MTNPYLQVFLPIWRASSRSLHAEWLHPLAITENVRVQHVLLVMPHSKHPEIPVEVLVLLLGVALVLLMVALPSQQTTQLHPMVLAEAQALAVEK